jgi:alpha-L-rhamnosidase
MLFSFLLLSATMTRAALQPGQLTCEYIINPLGIDTKLPRFNWTLQSTGRNQYQSAYEIIVSDDLKRIQAGTGTHWSTGKIITSQTLHIVYNGNALQSRKRYYWRVKVYDKEGHASNWSEPAWFEMAMLDAADWKAKWIGDGSVKPATDEDYYKADRMPLLKKPFNIRKNIAAARLYISGLGYYEAYLNGAKVSDHVLDPGFTTYRKQVLYVVHDVTKLLKKGANTAGVMLGNGWWNPLPFHFFGRWDLRHYQQTGRPCVKAELHIQYADGAEDNIVTDESWQTAPGAITHNNIYLGEQYDARLEQKDWHATSTHQDNWAPAVVMEGPQGILTPQLQPAIKITQVIKPISIKEQGKDTFIVDMGQNFAGVARIKVKGAAGTTISMRYGEALFENGTLNYMTAVATQIKKGGIKGGPGAPETAWQEDGYILKGEGTEVWWPRFTFHGFRYVEITGWPGVPTVDDIEGLRMNSDLPLNGRFACSNDLFNQLHNVIQWTFLSNVFSVQSDCPAREKMGYGGDMVATANAFMYNYNMAHFYRKTVRDFANEQRSEGGITEIAPFTGIADKGLGNESGPLGWQLAFPFVQKQLYDYYGDIRVIQDNYEAFKKQLAFLKSKAVDGMFYWDISDHEALDAKPEALSASCFYYHHLQLAAEFAGILHKQDDSVQFAKQAQQLKNAIARKFLVKGTGRFDNGTQSAQLFALWYKLSPEKELSLQVLLDECKRHSDHISTGIFSTQMLFDVLRENNLQELAYRIVNQRSFPGWGYMLQNNATTLWESWRYPGTVYSFNHPMFGSVDEWFYRSVLGINAAAPGFEKIIIKPQPPDSLQWAKGSYESIRGLIGSDWKKSANTFTLNVTIPTNTTAEIWVPCKAHAPLTEGGEPMQSVRYEQGYAVVTVGSGTYAFITII